MRCQYYISDFDNYIVALSTFQYLVKYLEAKGIISSTYTQKVQNKSAYVCICACMCTRVCTCACACTCVWREIDKANVIKCEHRGEHYMENLYYFCKSKIIAK